MESFKEKNDIVKATRFPYTEKWKETFAWADPSTLGEQYTYCSSCQNNLSTFSKGFPELQRHVQTQKHKKRAKIVKGRQNQASKPFPYSNTAVQFIRSHFNTGSAQGEQTMKHFAHCKVGLEYPKDIISVCQHTPYCIYIYEGVPSGKYDTVSVVLVGFFDIEASGHCIRFVDAFQSVDGSGAADVVQTVKKFGLSTDNLVAVYFSGNDAASEQICSQLMELNPNITALGCLYSIADTACLAGVKQLSNQVQEFMVDLQAHHFSCSTKNDSLKALFGSDKRESSKSFALDTDCLRFCLLVTKMLETWTDLIFYFSSVDEDDEKAKLICSQLKDPKVKATFMFLEQALKPLQKFQSQTQGTSWDNMLLIIEKASTLLSTYTSYFLQPHAAVRYLKEHDAHILKNQKFLLSSPDLNLGGEAVEDFLKKAEAAEVLPQLQKEALSFYIALTGSLAEGLPLSDRGLKSIVELLNPQNRLKVTEKDMEELGTKLGICSSPEQVKQLTSEFLENQLAEEGESEGEANDNTTLMPLEKYWARILKNTKPNSIFRKLVLTLLSFPCPPLDAQHVFTQVCEGMIALPHSVCVFFSSLSNFLLLFVCPV